MKFSSQPSTVANEGDAYSYTPTASDTAEGAVSFALSLAPAGATLTGNTLTWTPTSAQSRVANSFTLTATSTAGGSARQTWSITPTGMIRGQQMITWNKLDGTSLDGPNDLTNVPINVLVPSSSGYQTLPGTGALGTFSIPKVPAGYYWLQFGNDYFQTSRSKFDLGFDVVGRWDAAFATGLTRYLQIGGMLPWQPNDYLEWYSPNLNDLTSIRNLPGITTGDTALNFPWGVGGVRMLDASKGDTAYLMQKVPTAYGSMLMNNLAKIYQITGLTETDGQTNYIVGTFVDVPLSGSIEGNVKGATIAGMRSAINPKGTADGTYFFLAVLPFGSSKGWYGNAPDLVAYSGPPIDLDEDDGPLPYGNPFDPNWPLALVLDDSVKLDYSVPGIGTVSKWGYTSLWTTSMPTAAQAIEPLVGAVTAPRVNGMDFFQDQTLNTFTPVISWNPPAFGTPTAYVVDICKWDAASLNADVCRDNATMVARFHTKNTSILVPSGILDAGSSYYLVIESTFMAGSDIESAPYRLSLPLSDTRSLSGIINVGASGGPSFGARYKRLSSSVEQRIQPPEIRRRVDRNLSRNTARNHQ